jgi:two-component system, cell cycle sensor histidine kinase and response regulator CckA
MILAEDITERKHVQVALREREVQLQRMQKMDAVGRLAGGVSHDFNNLLSIIILSARLAGRHAHDPRKLAGEIDTILATARRGSALTRRLLAFSAPKRVNPEVVDINAIIADVSKMLRLVIGEDLQFVTTLSEAPCHVVVDPGQVEQVLLNLVLNARDAMPRGGRLELCTEVVAPGPEMAAVSGPSGTVRVEVTDTGCGMNPETAARVFEPFFTTKPHGTGLGLATVHGIVTQSGGEITVSSREGAGTTFTILLPRQVATPATDADVVASAPAVGATTILLVEDEPRLRRVTRQLLEEEGHTVIEAENGVTALARCRALSRPVDLLLTDVVMPEMGGPRLAQELLKRYPHLPVLYMSGYHGASLASEELELATSPILAKPFAPEDLIRKVNEILEHQPRRPVRDVEPPGDGSHQQHRAGTRPS